MQTEKGAVLKLNSFFLFEYEQLSTKLGTTFKKYLLHSGRSIDSCNDAVYPLVKNINRISGVCWKKVLHLKQNLILKYQPEKIWNLFDILFNLWK